MLDDSPIAPLMKDDPPISPADFRAEVAAFDKNAKHGIYDGPRYRMRYRVLGEGPAIILIPGIASTYRGYALTLNRLSSRFQTIVYDYPGEHPDDGANLRAIRHDDLVGNLPGLLDHLRLKQANLFGLSFGSTVTLSALHREPGRFPMAAIQGGFAHRRFSAAERLALVVGRRIPGTASRIPLRNPVLRFKNRDQFPSPIADRWPLYVEENGLTPIASLAHRLDLVARLDLRPLLPEIRAKVLLVQGTEDNIVPDSHFKELLSGLPNAQASIMQGVGHQPHYTHAEDLAVAVGDWFLNGS